MHAKLPNRWVIAAGAIAIQICCGSLYSWSVFVKPLTASQPWTLVQVSAAFQIALAFIGIGAMLGGLWQDRIGPRLVISVGGVLYGCGFLISAFSTEHHSLAGLYLGYGLISGIGIGMAYICPVAAIVKWFPDRRGLMIGATVMGYGAGAVFMGPIAARLIIHSGVPATFRIFSLVYFAIVVGAGQLQLNPPPGWCPAGWEPRTAVSRMASRIDYTVKEAIRTWRFWLLWLLLVINTSAGIMIISQASPLAQQQVGMSVIEASSVVAAISIFNALGRIVWAWTSDRMGRAQVYFALFAIQVGVFFALPHLHAAIPFEIAVCTIALCYGGGFSVLPILAADFFGPRYMGGIYGWITMATWVVAAIPSPLLIAHVREVTGTYDYAITVIGFVMVASLPLPLLAARAASRIATEQAALKVS
ncbi:MAG: OFA family MFS transporter [Acidobacteriia bacterium]|nr:OFA family MFS transporter [Terriglobia bacterium]